MADEAIVVATRRRFLQGTGLLVGASVLEACTEPLEEVQSDVATCPDPLDGLLSQMPTKRLDVAGAKMPFRQDDPRWGNELMWDRDLVLRAATELQGLSAEEAEALMREFDDGNTIGNEGCMLTCLAMALRLLVPEAQEPWTPGLLNWLAHEMYYYTPSGLSLTTLYGDLVSDASLGEVQLYLKEEYLPGQTPWPRVYPQSSPLVRAYRSLPPGKRSDFVVMLKTGTYDDTIASHYALLHPDDEGGPDDDNPLLLDPAQPLEMSEPWRLRDSAAWILTDPEIARGWAESGIEANQIGGVWVFVRWDEKRERSKLAPLVMAWARELAR